MFRYVTITGGIATVRIVGVGSLAGTSVDSSGALHLVYGGTNVYSKITGTVKGGGGHATLASMLNAPLIASGQPEQPEWSRRYSAGLGADAAASTSRRAAPSS